MTSPLAAAYDRLQHPIHRVRYGELCVIEKHVHVEAITVRDGLADTTISKGLRFLLRLQPIDELPPTKPRVDFEVGPEHEFHGSWFDPVPEGPAYQWTVAVFVGLEEISTLHKGVKQIAQAGTRWREQESYSTAEWQEAVFGWEENLVFGVMKRDLMEMAFIEARSHPHLYFECSPHRLWKLCTWLKQSEDRLQEAP